MLVYVISAVFAYLIGNIQTAVIISNFKHRKDIREYGSGNAGATNMLRVFGLRSGIVTFTCDILKAVIAMLFAWLIGGQDRTLCGYIAALFVILGHDFPVFFKFSGGKGVASTLAILFMTAPFPEAVIVLSLAALIILFTKTISLASLVGMGTFVALVAILRTQDLALIILSAILYCLIIIRHIDNIKRLLKGTESKLTAIEK